MTDAPIRLRRSALYMPASNERAIAKARDLPCDVVILDLEDAVAPDAKATARESAIAAVRAGGFGRRELVVRCNGIDTEWGEADLAALSGLEGCAVLLPKISSADEVAQYRSRLTSETALWAMIETARSLQRLGEIADAGLDCFVLGTNDIVKDLRAQPPVDRSTLLPFLAFAVAAARASGLDILDGVFNDIADQDQFFAECRQGLALGFDGKTLIHPSQIAPCNAVFSPGEKDVAWSRRILAAFAAPENAARGAIKVDGKMVERLHLHHARRTIALAEAALG